MKRRIILACILISGGLCMSGCSLYAPYGLVGTNTQFQMNSTDYDILSETPVVGSSTAVFLLGLGGGDAGYMKAYEDALSQCPGANTLVDVKVDMQQSYFIFISTIKTRVTGFPAHVKRKK